MKANALSTENTEKIEDTLNRNSGLALPDTIMDAIASLPPGDRHKLRWEIFEERQVVWKLFLRAGGRGKVLIIGAGWGVVPANLANEAGGVYVLDNNRSRIALLQRALIGKGIKNVFLICSDPAGDLPFATGWADIVWVHQGVPDKPGNPEIARVLKQKGQLFFSMANPFNYRRWLLKTGTALPGSSGQTLPTRRRQRQILEASGFRRVDWYVPWPSVGPASNIGRPPDWPIRLEQTSNSWKDRLEAKILSGRMGARASPSYGVVASKDPGSTALFERILEDIPRELKGGLNRPDGPVSVRRMFVSPTQVLIAEICIRDKSAKHILKIPLSPIASKRLSRSTRGLEAVFSILSDHPEHLAKIPRVVCSGNMDGQVYFVETRLEGVPASRLQAGDGKLLRQATEFLLFLHEQTARLVSADDSWIEHSVRRPFALVSRLIQNGGEKRKLRKIEERIIEGLAGSTVREGRSHGDFKPSNIMMDGRDRHLTGVFDWDQSAPDGWPALDLFHFWGGWRASGRDIDLQKTLHGFFPLKIENESDEFFRSCFESVGIPRERLPLYCVMYWIRQVEKKWELPSLYGKWVEMQPEWVQKNVVAVLRHIVSTGIERVS